MVQLELNSRPPAWQPDARPTEPPVAAHKSINSYLFPFQFNKMFGLPDKPSQPKGASLNGNLLGVDEFSMLQPSKENRDVQVCYSSKCFCVCVYVRGCACKCPMLSPCYVQRANQKLGKR